MKINLKEYIDIILPSLTKLVNCSLIEGCVPEAFKTAVLTPLIKKTNPPSDDLKNYRPVSGLSFISKLVQPVVAKQLLEHIHVHSLDNPYQLAYKAGRSTETALLCIKKLITPLFSAAFTFMQTTVNFMYIYPRRMHLLPLNS